MAAATWLAYDRIYARGDVGMLAWRDHTPSLGSPAFRRPATRALTSRGDLTELLDEEVRGRAPPAPALDFAREHALFATVGPRSSSGYAVEVVSIREERRRVVVRLRERTPSLDDRVEARVTYPFRLVTVARTEKAVEFEWEGR